MLHHLYSTSKQQWFASLDKTVLTGFYQISQIKPVGLWGKSPSLT